MTALDAPGSPVPGEAVPSLPVEPISYVPAPKDFDRVLDELPALREQAGQAASSIAATYDWDVVADETIALYETVLEARRGAGRRGRATV